MHRKNEDKKNWLFGPRGIFWKNSFSLLSFAQFFSPKCSSSSEFSTKLINTDLFRKKNLHLEGSFCNNLKRKHKFPKTGWQKKIFRFLSWDPSSHPKRYEICNLTDHCTLLSGPKTPRSRQWAPGLPKRISPWALSWPARRRTGPLYRGMNTSPPVLSDQSSSCPVPSRLGPHLT